MNKNNSQMTKSKETRRGYAQHTSSLLNVNQFFTHGLSQYIW